METYLFFMQASVLIIVATGILYFAAVGICDGLAYLDEKNMNARRGLAQKPAMLPPVVTAPKYRTATIYI